MFPSPVYESLERQGDDSFTIGRLKAGTGHCITGMRCVQSQACYTKRSDSQGGIRMKSLVWIAGVVAFLVIALLFFIYLGIYNVSALESHTGLVEWILRTAKSSSVRRQAESVEVPNLTEESRIRAGAGYYQASCATCHGAPGVAPAGLARGLNPPAPNLPGDLEGWPAAELFWMVKNGVRMSGMPAFARSYEEEQIWAIVAFLQRLPSLSPQQYQALLEFR